MLTTTCWLFRGRWSGASRTGRGGSERAGAAKRAREPAAPEPRSGPKPELERLRTQCAEDLRDLSSLPVVAGRRPLVLRDPVEANPIPQDRPD